MSRPSPELRQRPDLPFVEAPDGVRVHIRVMPRARTARIYGLQQDADGRARLQLAVTEPADDGRANAAVLVMLAREWQLPKSTLAIAAGGANRRKTIRITGDPRTLMTSLLSWSRTRAWLAGK
jgi:uncharacterized protein (TIGR00251 family)